jgi:hypothetical protein
LERLEAAAASNDRLIKVEFCNLSPTGEVIPIPNTWGIPDDDRPAQRTLQIIFADSDGNSGPGPRFLAYQRRLASEVNKPVDAEASHRWSRSSLKHFAMKWFGPMGFSARRRGMFPVTDPPLWPARSAIEQRLARYISAGQPKAETLTILLASREHVGQ